MLAIRVLSELIGCFVFFTVILVHGQPIPIAAALLAVCYFSGGHFNPAVSLMKFIANEVSSVELVVLIVVQIVAAILAVLYARAF